MKEPLESHEIEDEMAWIASERDWWGERGNCHADYGVELNHLSIAELFDAYRRYGFIYPEKAARLAPYLPVIQKNWEQALSGGDSLLWVATRSDTQTVSWASIASWRSTTNGWQTQHLVSNGNPGCSLAVMLSSLVVRYFEHSDQSHQNWFQPIKKYPRRVFGTIERSLGTDRASCRTHTYLSLSKSKSPSQVGTGRFHVADVTLDRDSMEMVCHLARQQRGDVYVQAEQLDGEDIALDGLNALYRRVGLFRSRRVIAVFRQTEELPCFAAIIWRGPLGMNFSFLENRCDLLAVNEKSAREGLAAAWPTLCEFYDDFLPGFIPFVVAPEQARAILEIGAEEICQYTQSIWLRDGFPAWYSHVASQFPLWAPQFPERGPQRDGESSSVERERQQ